MAKEEIEEVEEVEETEVPAAEGIVPLDDLKPLMDEVDRILAADAPVAEATMTEETIEEGPGEEVVEETAEEEVVEEAPEPALDLTPLMETLGLEEAQAQALYDAAQQIATLEGMEIDALAEALDADFQLRMQVEKIAGGMEDAMAADQAEIGIEADIAAGLPPAMPGAM